MRGVRTVKKSVLTAIKPWRKKLKRWSGNVRVSKYFALSSVGLLFVTTIYWSLLGAKLQMDNADQLAGPYLFDHATTLHQATFPNAHSQLIKWPVFWLVRLLGYSNASFEVFTVLLSAVTIAALVYLLWRIERRPVVFGTWCLALASMLLLVPPQPYAGGLLPVSMAMITTRNIEYIVYISAAALLLRAGKLRGNLSMLAVLSLGILFASDNLFVALGLGSALLMLFIYAATSKWRLVSGAMNWLSASILAAILAVVLLLLLEGLGVTHFGGATSGVPYNLTHSPTSLLLGMLYAIMGIITNFGANPAYDATIVTHIPHTFLQRLISVSGPAYLVNLMIVFASVYTAIWLVVASTRTVKAKGFRLDSATKLSLMLIASSIVAIVYFVATDHYYAVDARYLGIVLFAGFTSLATYGRRKRWPASRLYGVAGILLVACALGSYGAWRNYDDQHAALADVYERNQIIVQILKEHPVSTLVGDYWRVLPIRRASGEKVQVTPLSDCTNMRQVLSSKAWQPDLKTHSFAYLLPIDKGLTDFPACSDQQIIRTFGQPNASVVISGTLEHPKGLLLFYDHGAHPEANKVVRQTVSYKPVGLSQLTGTGCRGLTVMNIVAHEDDDLLFMNPDLFHSIAEGDCVRTVYVTAGDGGYSQYYWIGRERGSEAAYARMLGVTDNWQQQTVELGRHEYATFASPQNNPAVTLIFLQLPDGNLHGEGFANSGYQSLQKLSDGTLTKLTSVDDLSSYTNSDLTAALADLMLTYQPSEIRTLANYVSNQAPDHSDHMAVSRLTIAAYGHYDARHYHGEVALPIAHYIGYPIQTFGPNVSGSDLENKEAIFFTYAKYDGGVCNSMARCQRSSYHFYLPRQYRDD